MMVVVVLGSMLSDNNIHVNFQDKGANYRVPLGFFSTFLTIVNDDHHQKKRATIVLLQHHLSSPTKIWALLKSA